MPKLIYESHLRYGVFVRVAVSLYAPMNLKKGILENFADLTTKNQVDLLLYGYSSLNKSQNCDILNATISYMKKTRRFNNEVPSE